MWLGREEGLVRVLGAHRDLTAWTPGLQQVIATYSNSCQEKLHDPHPPNLEISWPLP